MSSSGFARTLESFSESGIMESIGEHAPTFFMMSPARVEYCCGLCKWRAKREWKLPANSDDAAAEAAERDREVVEIIRRQILHKFTHQEIVWPDEVEGPGSAVGRAWMQLKNAGVICDPGLPPRGSRKAYQKSRKIHAWKLVKEEAVTHGREGSEGTGGDNPTT